MTVDLVTSLEPFCAQSLSDDDFDDTINYDQDSEPMLEVWNSPFINDLEALARRYITLFFKGKRMYFGGPISRNLLCRQQYIDRVLAYDIDHAVEAIYNAWHTAALGTVTLKEVRRINLVGSIPSDVEAIVAVLRESAILGVPKPFAGGIVMMYFELCEGFDFDDAETPVAVCVA